MKLLPRLRATETTVVAQRRGHWCRCTLFEIAWLHRTWQIKWWTRLSGTDLQNWVRRDCAPRLEWELASAAHRDDWPAFKRAYRRATRRGMVRAARQPEIRQLFARAQREVRG
jgi:hypothetical protein